MTLLQSVWWLYFKAKQDTILGLIDHAYSLMMHSLASKDEELTRAMLEEVEPIVQRLINHMNILTDFFADMELTHALKERVEELIADYQQVQKLLYPALVTGS